MRPLIRPLPTRPGPALPAHGLPARRGVASGCRSDDVPRDRHDVLAGARGRGAQGIGLLVFEQDGARCDFATSFYPCDHRAVDRVQDREPVCTRPAEVVRLDNVRSPRIVPADERWSESDFTNSDEAAEIVEAVHAEEYAECLMSRALPYAVTRAAPDRGGNPGEPPPSTRMPPRMCVVMVWNVKSTAGGAGGHVTILTSFNQVPSNFPSLACVTAPKPATVALTSASRPTSVVPTIRLNRLI